MTWRVHEFDPSPEWNPWNEMCCILNRGWFSPQFMWYLCDILIPSYPVIWNWISRSWLIPTHPLVFIHPHRIWGFSQFQKKKPHPTNQSFGRSSLSNSFNFPIFLINQWIGLRENLQETIDFSIKYGRCPVKNSLNQSIESNLTCFFVTFCHLSQASFTGGRRRSKTKRWLARKWGELPYWTTFMEHKKWAVCFRWFCEICEICEIRFSI